MNETRLSQLLHSIRSSQSTAVLLAALSGLSFTVSNFMVQKTIELNTQQRIPTFEIVFVRSFIQLTIITPIILRNPSSYCCNDKTSFIWLILVGLFGYLNIVVTYLALDKIPLADTLVITFTSPFFCAIFSVVILKELCHWLDCLFGVISFIGVVLVARPKFIFGYAVLAKTVILQKYHLPDELKERVHLTGVLFALLGGICLAMYFVLTRKVSKVSSHWLCIFYPSLIGVTMTPVVMVLRQERPVIPASMLSNLSLLSVGITSCLGLAFLMLSLKLEDATFVTLIRNLDVIYAFLLQYFFMGIRPTWWDIGGGIVVIGATSLIVIRRWEKWENLKKNLFMDKEIKEQNVNTN